MIMSFIRLLGEVMARQFRFEINWPLAHTMGPSIITVLRPWPLQIFEPSTGPKVE